MRAHIVLAEPGNLPQYGWAEVADELESLAACQSDGGRTPEEIQATLQRLSDVDGTHQVGLSSDSIRASLPKDEGLGEWLHPVSCHQGRLYDLGACEERADATPLMRPARVACPPFGGMCFTLSAEFHAHEAWACHTPEAP